MPVVRKRLRSSIACERCRANKRRCDGKIPCDVCVKRSLECTYPSANNAIARADAASPDAIPIERPMLDFPFAAKATVRLLIERYFARVEPLWAIVARSDLDTQPFAPPLLLRSVCLVSAMSLESDEECDQFSKDIVESIRQCFDSFDLMSQPSLSTLQSLLLLLACPNFTQSSMLVASACRMALILGCHRSHYARPALYWTCIMFARWDAFERLHHPSDGYTLCFDLESVPPPTEPDPKTAIGTFYHALQRYEQHVRMHNMHTMASWRAARETACQELISIAMDFSHTILFRRATVGNETSFIGFRYRHFGWINRMVQEGGYIVPVDARHA